MATAHRVLASRVRERLLRLPSPLTRDILVERDLPVPMPDGVILLADRYVGVPDANRHSGLPRYRKPTGLGAGRLGPRFGKANGTAANGTTNGKVNGRAIANGKAETGSAGRTAAANRQQ